MMYTVGTQHAHGMSGVFATNKMYIQGWTVPRKVTTLIIGDKMAGVTPGEVGIDTMKWFRGFWTTKSACVGPPPIHHATNSN